MSRTKEWLMETGEREVDLLLAEIEQLRGANRVLLETQDRITHLMGAEVARLEWNNARLIGLLQAVRPYVAYCAEGDDAEMAREVLAELEEQVRS